MCKRSVIQIKKKKKRHKLAIFVTSKLWVISRVISHSSMHKTCITAKDKETQGFFQVHYTKSNKFTLTRSHECTARITNVYENFDNT